MVYFILQYNWRNMTSFPFSSSVLDLISFCSSSDNLYLSWFDWLQNTGLDTKVLVPGYESTGLWIQKYWSLDTKVLVRIQPELMPEELKTFLRKMRTNGSLWWQNYSLSEFFIFWWNRSLTAHSWSIPTPSISSALHPHQPLIHYV